MLRTARRRLSSRSACSSARKLPDPSRRPPTGPPCSLRQGDQDRRGRRPATPEPPPMLTRSLPSVARATVQPLLGSPDHVLVGHEDVVEEHLVELRAAGDLPQRSHLDPGCVHVDDHGGDAGVLGRLRIGAHGGQTALAVVRAAGPHLLAVDAPAALDADRAGLDRRGVRAGVRFGEQLAPHLFLAQCLIDESFDLRRGSVLDQRQDHPAGDAVVGPLDTRRRRNSCSMTSCSTASAARPHGLGQCGITYPVSISRCRSCGCPSSVAISCGVGANPGPQFLGLRRQVDAVLPGHARQRSASNTSPAGPSPAEQPRATSSPGAGAGARRAPR